MLEVKLIQACSDKPEFIAEVKIGSHLNMERLHKVLCDSQSFNNVTYLRKAGILRALIKSKSIILFRNGRVTVNCVKDMEEASTFARFLVEALKLQ